MAKVITEQDIKKLHRGGKLDRRLLERPKPIASEKPAAPDPLPEIEAMNKVLNQLVEIFRTSKDISDRNDKVAEFLAKKVEALESRMGRPEKPRDFDIIPERGEKDLATKYKVRFI